MLSSAEITIDTDDGPMPAFEALPDGDPKGSIVVVQEAFGVTAHIRNVAQRLADDGWRAVAPAFFHRQGSPVFDYDDLASVMPVMGALSATGLEADLEASFDYLGRAPEQTGIVGFCMGGTVAFLAATLEPIGAAVTFYGGGVDAGRFGLAPLIELAPKLQTPWLGCYGDLDKGISVDSVEQLRAAARTAPVETEVVRYADADHGFHCDDRPTVFNPIAAHDAWERTLQWFDRHLGGLTSPYDLSRADLDALLAGEPPYRAGQVWAALHHRAAWGEEMTELPRALRDRLGDALAPALVLLDRRLADGGETVKLVFSAGGRARVETVLMAYPGRVTVCVSTQAGCAMGCPFCATGQGGFVRQLRSGEIVEQVAWAMRERPVTHVVFMGMGEPLANYDQTLGALRRLRTEMGLSARRLTVSTVGIVPGIRRLAAEPLPVNLAVSLHAANDTLRDELVPINRRYPLSVLGEACAQYVAATRRRLSLEWAVIGGVNDRPSDARELAAFARPLRAHVNLIPLNATDGYRAPGRPQARQFRSLLVELGINATLRRTRGTEIEAACGQLAGRAPEN